MPSINQPDFLKNDLVLVLELKRSNDDYAVGQ